MAAAEATAATKAAAAEAPRLRNVRNPPWLRVFGFWGLGLRVYTLGVMARGLG